MPTRDGLTWKALIISGTDDKEKIDKVLIRYYCERLTQPGKITLVYFDRNDIEDYSLEDLQRELGMKALMAGVVTN